MSNKKIAAPDDILYQQISDLIEQSQKQIAIQANSTLTLLFWKIGFVISSNILSHKRAEYGKHIVSAISIQLENHYGRNFTEKNVRRMIQFAQEFPDKQIVVTVSRQLSWSHFLILLTLKNPEAKVFYTQLASTELLGVRALRDKINRKAFERMEIANIQNAASNILPLNTFKDPYLLDFLQLQNTFLESDLEHAILRELEAFILELGKGFAFMERQKRMIIDSEDFYLDLLFFNRNLKRLIAIELKLGKFQAAHKGQMELYLKWLDKYEKKEGENPPIGLILCAETNKEQVELLEMNNNGIMVAEYLTEMPPKAELEKKLHQLLIEAHERLERKKLNHG